MKRKHTAPPWEAAGNGVFKGVDCLAIFKTERGSMDDANSRLCAHAVNCHADLVATLFWVREHYAGGNTAEINARIDAVLAKAGRS